MNKKPSGGKTPVHEAVKKGDKRLVSLLLGKGADVDAAPSGSNAPLSDAVKDGDIEMVKILLAYGANINAKPSGGDSALYKAISKGKKDIVEILLNHSGSGRSIVLEDAITQAQEHGDRSTVEMLSNWGSKQ